MFWRPGHVQKLLGGQGVLTVVRREEGLGSSIGVELGVGGDVPGAGALAIPRLYAMRSSGVQASQASN